VIFASIQIPERYIRNRDRRSLVGIGTIGGIGSER
jgi:hypothetical protein